MRAVLSHPTLPIGHKLLWYEIEAVLGQGGFGITYAAVDTNLNHKVAIKEFFPRIACYRDTVLDVQVRSDEARDEYEWGLRRFVDEARTLARFRHPNIVQVRTAFEHNRTAYMVMDLERGDTLGEIAKTDGVPNEITLLSIVGPLLHGLKQVHAAGFIHRDIKVDNIIIRADGTPVLVDFGSSRQSSDALDRGLTALVTRGYAPFEQYTTEGAGRMQGPWGDIYSFAAVLYVIVTGKVPIDAISRSTSIINRSEDLLVPATTLAGTRYSAQLLTAIDKGLAFSFHDRPQTVQAWIDLFPDSLRVESSVLVREPDSTVIDDVVTEVAPRTRSVTTALNNDKDGVDPRTLPLSFDKLNVLVVDDERHLRTLMQRVLQRLDVRTTAVASSGRMALEILDRGDPPVDVIVLDLKMPDMDGIEMLRALSTRSIRPGIVLISGVDPVVLKSAEEFARSHFLNVLGSATKPVRPESLFPLLQHYVETVTNPLPEPSQPQATLTEAELLEGMHSDALLVYYQPKISLTTNSIIGVEALARWRLPNGEIIGPGSFIPLAEKTQHIHALTLAVLTKAFSDCGDWNANGFDLKLAVNVSANSFSNLDFPDVIEELTAQAGVSPDSVILEVTERMVAEDILAMMDILMRLRLKGITLSIDDFGTGYSSLQLLHKLPFSELKIDREFVSGADTDSRAYSILEASVALARNLGLSTIAEGVESGIDWRTVSEVGCDMVQGFYIAKPMPSDELLNWTANRRTPDR